MKIFHLKNKVLVSDYPGSQKWPCLKTSVRDKKPKLRTLWHSVHIRVALSKGVHGCIVPGSLEGLHPALGMSRLGNYSFAGSHLVCLWINSWKIWWKLYSWVIRVLIAVNFFSFFFFLFFKAYFHVILKYREEFIDDVALTLNAVE